MMTSRVSALLLITCGLVACNDSESPSACGAPGSHSHLVNGQCTCEAGYGWQDLKSTNFNCIPLSTTCVPDCSNRECGWDPLCGQSCGICAEGRCEAGQCIDESCIPACGGLACGPDPACGQSCGSCMRGTCTPEGQCSTLGLACDLVTQAPCLTGEKCSLDLSGEPRCVTAGIGGEGSACTLSGDSDSCGRGLYCIASVIETTMRCYRYCSDHDSCHDGSACLWTIAGASLCSLPCDPWNDDCTSNGYCAGNETPTGMVFTCMEMPTEGLADLGEACSASVECRSAQLCAAVDSADPVCYRVCDSEHACPSGSCIPLQIDGTPIPQGACDECFPDCSGRECGVDPVCGTTCGECTEGVCQDDGQCCIPDCSGRQCGLDPVCGTSCGDCTDGVCQDDGQCCTPDCSGRECGVDPVCGASCGACTGSDTCDDGQCVCIPSCGTRECGPDPSCGTTCGTCGGVDICQSGSCCAPNCGGRECGNDPACGTLCGVCSGSDYCQSGTCVACQPLYGTCSTTSQCCQQVGVDIECDWGSCQQCAGYGYDCSSVSCCSGLFCNPAGMCHTRDCSETGMACVTNYDCCDDTICDPEAGDRCQYCREQYTVCSTSSQCCSGLSCSGGMCQ